MQKDDEINVMHRKTYYNQRNVNGASGRLGKIIKM